MLYIVNNDAPGFIGAVGTILGEAGINIGTFHLGRREAGGEAILLLSVDGDVSQDLIRKIEARAQRAPGDVAQVLSDAASPKSGRAPHAGAPFPVSALRDRR